MPAVERRIARQHQRHAQRVEADAGLGQRIGAQPVDAIGAAAGQRTSPSASPPMNTDSTVDIASAVEPKTSPSSRVQTPRTRAPRRRRGRSRRAEPRASADGTLYDRGDGPGYSPIASSTAGERHFCFIPSTIKTYGAQS